MKKIKKLSVLEILEIIQNSASLQLEAFEYGICRDDIESAIKEVKRLKQVDNEYSWVQNPDRMGM